MNTRWLLFGLVATPLLFHTNEVLAQQAIQEAKLTSDISGNFRMDFRYFPEDALYPGQRTSYFSSFFQPEIYLEWNDGKQALQFTGFARLDQFDTASTHADIRELYWLAILKKLEISVGIKKIFWGVTESNHLVDIINQADALEGFDLEQKLGQPMIHISLTQKWGTIDLHAMICHRPMKFPGPRGRPRPPFALDYSNTTYESELEQYNPDFAIRWSHSFSVFDIGLSHFYGTSRIPLFTTTNGTIFIPHYELINQSGIDVQASTGSMLWKAEAIQRVSKRRKPIRAFTAGGEYTFSNLFRSGVDIGLIAEYTNDDRGMESINALDSDLFFATRVAVNDRQSTDFIGGIIVDLNNQTLRYVVEANRRLGNSWKISVEAAGFKNVAETEFIYLIRKDSYLKTSLAMFF